MNVVCIASAGGQRGRISETSSKKAKSSPNCYMKAKTDRETQPEANAEERRTKILRRYTYLLERNTYSDSSNDCYHIYCRCWHLFFLLYSGSSNLLLEKTKFYSDLDVFFGTEPKSEIELNS